MVQRQHIQPPGTISRLSRLGRKMLIAYTVIYVIELICVHWINLPVVQWLQLYPLASPAFHIWQIVTHPFLQNPFNPIGFLLSCLGFYFFAAPVEHHLGRRQFLTVFYLTALCGALIGGLFSYVDAFSTIPAFSYPFLGMVPSVLALVVMYGFIHAEATIFFMFVLPLKAKYISYITIGITVLAILAKTPDSAFHLGGILSGWAIIKRHTIQLHLRLLHLRYLEHRLNRRKSRFKVYHGGKDNDGPPTIH